MKIKMIQHYCGYLNGMVDYYPQQEVNVPEDVTEVAARELIERGYAAEIEDKRVIQAAEKMGKAVKTNREK